MIWEEKISERQTKAGNQITLSLLFHVSAQKSLSHSHTLSMSHSDCFTLSFTHSRHSEQLLFSFLCSKVGFYVLELKMSMGFFDSLITRPTEIRDHRAGSQLKMSERQTKAGNQEFQSLNVIENFQ